MAAKRSKTSAGLLLYRRAPGANPEVFLAHPGGPFWAKKDEGVWTIPKGETESDKDDLLSVALREFCEETSLPCPTGPFLSLGTVRQKSGKIVHAWACECDVDPAQVRSNTATIEWPPRSGRTIEIPEIDRCAWFNVATARRKLNPAQVAFLDRLSEMV
jgi:predicted NUDIX family NTP pyrophosphohydrolase